MATKWRQVATQGRRGWVCRQVSPTCRHPESQASWVPSPESPLSPRLNVEEGQALSKRRLPGGEPTFRRASIVDRATKRGAIPTISDQMAIQYGSPYSGREKPVTFSSAKTYAYANGLWPVCLFVGIIYVRRAPAAPTRPPTSWSERYLAQKILLRRQLDHMINIIGFGERPLSLKQADEWRRSH